MILLLAFCLCLSQTLLVSGMHDGGCCASITNVTLVSATAASVEFVYPFHNGESLLFEVVQDNTTNGNSTQFAVGYDIVNSGLVEYDYLYTGLDLSDTYCFRIIGTRGGTNRCYDQVSPVCLNTTQEYLLGAVPIVSTFHYVHDVSNTSIVVFSWSLSDYGDGILSCFKEDTVDSKLFFFKGVFQSSPATVLGFQDSALYTCYLSGQNSYGVGINMSVSFRTRPLPPAFVNVSALRFDMIRVSWSHSSSEPVEFTVRINSQCSRDRHGYVSYNAYSGTSLDVSPLTPFTLYCVDVIANSTGENLESMPSQMVSVRTLEAVPGPVHSLLVIPLSSTALFIRWSEPDIKNGIILGYSVEIVGSYQNLMDNDTGFVQVNHLSPCQEYTVEVSASTSAGTGQMANFFSRTLDSVPSRPEIASVDLHHRLVSWSISTPAACLKGSIVTYTPLYSIDRPISVNYSHSDRYITEDLPSDLKETVAYNVTVSAYGPAGFGEISQSFPLAPLLTRYPSVFSVSDRTDYVQLIFIGIKNCTAWKIGVTENDIGSLLTYRLSLICPHYDELSNNQWIIESSLMCLETTHQVVFRFHSIVRLAVKQCLEYWYSSPSPFLKLQNQIMLVDTSCNHLYTHSLLDELCFEASDSGLVGGLFGGLVLGGLLACVVFLIVLAVCFRNRICGICSKETDVADTENEIQAKLDDDDGYEELPFVGSRGHNGMTGEDEEAAYVDVNIVEKNVKQSKRAVMTTTKDVNPQTFVRESNINDPEYELPEIVMQNKHFPGHSNVGMPNAECDISETRILSSVNVETLSDSKKQTAASKATLQQKPESASQNISNHPIAANSKHVSSKAIRESVPQEQVKTGASKVPMLPPTKLDLKHERNQLHTQYGQGRMAVTALSTGKPVLPGKVCAAKPPVHSKVRSDRIQEAERATQKIDSLPLPPSSSVAQVSMQKPASGNKKRPLLPKSAVGQNISVGRSGISSKSATIEPAKLQAQAPKILPKPKNKSTKNIPLSTNRAYEQWTITKSDAA